MSVLSNLAPAEWLRPWKLASLAVGMCWLIWGALTLNIGDWDVGVSILMGGFTYLLAPCSARILLRRHWKTLPVALFFWWWCVDGVYMVWHLAAGNPIYREANFYASTCLYWLCGFIWLPKASLRQIVRNPRAIRY
ncbi:MAG: hypothetical protein LBI31_02990 [Zoogloeaceae bacterium]|jgi:hypothetical protein|nr:hypothetical protein [Zoogloeaceae bacterium]